MIFITYNIIVQAQNMIDSLASLILQFFILNFFFVLYFRILRALMFETQF